MSPMRFVLLATGLITCAVRVLQQLSTYVCMYNIALCSGLDSSSSRPRRCDI